MPDLFWGPDESPVKNVGVAENSEANGSLEKSSHLISHVITMFNNLNDN